MGGGAGAGNSAPQSERGNGDSGGGRNNREPRGGRAGRAQHPRRRGPHVARTSQKGSVRARSVPSQTACTQTSPGWTLTQTLQGRPGAATRGHGCTHSRRVCTGATLTCHRRGTSPPATRLVPSLKRGAAGRRSAGRTTILPRTRPAGGGQRRPTRGGCRRAPSGEEGPRDPETDTPGGTWPPRSGTWAARPQVSFFSSPMYLKSLLQ